MWKEEVTCNNTLNLKPKPKKEQPHWFQHPFRGEESFNKAKVATKNFVFTFINYGHKIVNQPRLEETLKDDLVQTFLGVVT